MEFLLEVGVEEVPAGFLPGGRSALRDEAARMLAAAGGTYADDVKVVVHASPRRLVLRLSNLEERSDDAQEVHKGPPARVAFDAAGKPTKAAEGFAKKVGVTVGDLARDGEYVIARVTVPGRTTSAILTEGVPKILQALPWPKSMRWNETQVRFVRPVRWIVALLGSETLPLSWSGIHSGRTTWLRRPAAEGGVSAPIEIASAGGYLDALRENGIFVDESERVRLLEDGIAAVVGREKAEAVYMDGETSLPYLADHVESPQILVGEFDEVYTSAPREVLELTMWRHQKYIPLVSGERLLPRFLIVANRTFGEGRTPDEEARRLANIIAGNRRVLSARLADARYFWSVDRERPLASRVDDLGRVTFQRDVGSVLDRVNRIEERAARFAPLLGVTAFAEVKRAARLAKADLTTKMVFEFPELQGVIGRRIAEAEGETPEVAAAIQEHYWPLGADAQLPRGISAVVALAEKADTLESIFGVGLTPTGSADPFGLRRAAIGVIRILLDLDHAVPVDAIIARPDVLEFVRARALNYLAEKDGVPGSILDAVAAVGWTDLLDLRRRAAAAAKLPARADFGDLATSFKRVMNILESSEAMAPVDAALLVEPAEKDLHASAVALAAEVDRALSAGNVDAALTAMAGIRSAVDRFFDDVLVNAEAPALRANRKALLRSIGAVFLRVLDFSRL